MRAKGRAEVLGCGGGVSSNCCKKRRGCAHSHSGTSGEHTAFFRPAVEAGPRRKGAEDLEVKPYPSRQRRLGVEHKEELVNLLQKGPLASGFSKDKRRSSTD